MAYGITLKRQGIITQVASTLMECHTTTSKLICHCKNDMFAGQVHCVNAFHMRRSRKFCQRGSNFDKVFILVDEG